MKKNVNKTYKLNAAKVSEVNEAAAVYNVSKNSTGVSKTKIYDYKQFAKVMQKVDFTLADWANLLFISERTLMRYAKADSTFNGLQVERIVLLEKMIDLGIELFGSNFAKWLKKPSIQFNGNTCFAQLYSYEGIQSVINYINRLEHGIFA